MSEAILETKEKNIDGMKFSVTVFPGLNGLKIKGKLVKIIGPAIGKALGSVDFNNIGKGKSLLDVELNSSMLGSAISALTEQLDNPEVITLILDLLASTTVDGQQANKKEVFNIKFAGKYITLYKSLLFVIEVNHFFGDGSIGNLFESQLTPATKK